MGPPEVRGGPEGHCASSGARTTAAPCTAGVVLGPLRSGHRAGRAGLQAAESSQLCSWWGHSRESRSREQPPGPPLACELHPRSRGWWPARSPTLTFKRQGLHGTPHLGGGHSPCRTWHKRAARGQGRLPADRDSGLLGFFDEPHRQNSCGSLHMERGTEVPAGPSARGLFETQALRAERTVSLPRLPFLPHLSSAMWAPAPLIRLKCGPQC